MKLFHKWLLVITFPIVIEFLFLTILAFLLVNYDQEVAAQRDAQAINLKLHALGFLAGETGLTVAEYRLSRSPSLNRKVEHNTRLMNEEFEKLRRLVGRSDLREGVERLESDWNNGFRLAKALKSTSDIDESVDEPTLLQALRVRKALKVISADEESLATSQIADLKRLEKDRDAAKFAIIVCLVILFLTTLSIPVVLKLLVTDDIVRRVKHLNENSLRLATYKDWAPSNNSAKDEIGILDKTFQEMASKLSDSIDRESAIFYNSVDMLCALDANQRIIRANQAWGEVLGFNEVLETHLVEYIDERHRQSLQNLLIEAQEGAGRTHKTKITLRSASGAPINTHWSVVWEPTEKRFFCVARDLTEIDRLERAKQRFRRMLGEDLRKPLVSVKVAFARLVRGELGSLSVNRLNILSRARLSVDRLILLADELLDLDKLESGLISLTISRSSMSELIGSAVNALTGIAESSGITLEGSSPDFQVSADRDALVRVVVNLLSNAIKFSPEGSKISVVSNLSDGYAEIQVIDQGQGISEQFLPQVFDRFKQANRTDRTVKQGSGLGLAICKTIVEAHGGTIGVTSTEGQGSCFWVRIPQP